MTEVRNHLLRLLRDEDGPSAVEYAVMLGLIIVVCLVAIAAIGSNSNANFNSPKLVNALQSGS